MTVTEAAGVFICALFLSTTVIAILGIALDAAESDDV